MIKCIILGGGGHTKGLLDTIKEANTDYHIEGILDPDIEKRGDSLLGINVIGDDELLPDFLAKGVRHFIVGLGGAGDCKPRMRLFNHAIELGFKPLSIIHPSSYISSFASIGNGLQVMPHVSVMPGARIFDNVIINTGAIVEHDCMINSHSHISSGAHLAGNVSVGICSHLGIGSVVKQDIKIGDFVLVGAGAVVVKDISDNQTVVGNPAKKLEKTV